MADDASDLDIGVYYKKENLDYSVLNAITKQLDDEHRENPGKVAGGHG